MSTTELVIGTFTEHTADDGKVTFDVRCSACQKWLCGDGVRHLATAERRFDKHAEVKHGAGSAPSHPTRRAL